MEYDTFPCNIESHCTQMTLGVCIKRNEPPKKTCLDEGKPFKSCQRIQLGASTLENRYWSRPLISNTSISTPELPCSPERLTVSSSHHPCTLYFVPNLTWLLCQDTRSSSTLSSFSKPKKTGHDIPACHSQRLIHTNSNKKRLVDQDILYTISEL